MYKKVDTSLDFVAREQEIVKFWKENKIFEKSIQKNEGGEEFSFFDGPPTANGKPHIGHVLTRVMKDLIPRYHTMKGRHVLRKAGWDTHGLPVELEVEKSLGMDGKQDIEKYGIEPFIKKCKESVWKYQSEWEKMSDAVGYWVDMEHPYVTYHDDYIESVWWALKEIHKKGLLYKGHKIVPYCPRCGTALSSHEVAQGYKDVKEASVIARFAVMGSENTYILAWTTTPWTLPSNVALCMNPEEDYIELAAEDGTHYILAEALAGKFFENYEVVSRRKGKEYEGMAYAPLFPWAQGSFKEKAYYVVCDGYVTLTEGTGVVHIAPAFGEDDYKVGKRYHLPVVQLVNERGCFDERCPELCGLFAKKADPVIIEMLKTRGLLFKKLMFEHSYPHCWRCDTPLLYYARSSWFVEVTKVKEELIAANRSVNWIPETIKEGRMGNFLENVIDWGLSRDRYWGTPLPVWVCEDCGNFEVIGSKEELIARCGAPAGIELHRPYLDGLTCKCSKCGGTCKRTPEVIDCWFDSGSMPFAQYHYPFENKDLFEETFPADFISEAVDQTRGWFYVLLVISTILFGRAPFKNCIVLGHVNDKDGVKMSKHKGNVVDPWTVLSKQGADAVRWYFYTNSAPWIPSRFGEEAVSETQRKFQGTVWNTYAFFTLYAEIAGYDPSKHDLKACKLSLMDRWVLSKLNTLVKETDRMLGEYAITESARGIQDFVDELSNWYVRRGRDRYWGATSEDSEAAFTTLYTVLVTLSKLLAPYMPFMAEMMYQNLVPAFFPEAPRSVHLTGFPVCDEGMEDTALEAGMEDVLHVVELGRSARSANNLKNRQPLSEMLIASDRTLGITGELERVTLEELNVHKLRLTHGDGELITYTLKPQLRTLGPKYGKKLRAIGEFLATCDAKTVVETVKRAEAYVVDLDGEVALTEEDLQIFTASAAGYATAQGYGITVALETALTEELLEEGTARELAARIQSMRKEEGFELTDRINVFYFAEDGRAKRVLGQGLRGEALSQDVRSAQGSFTACENGEGMKPFEINGETVYLRIERL